MTITHHLDEATILAYAAGTLGEAHGFAVATHLAFCATCRQATRQAECVGGELLLAEAPTAVSDTCRAATLASLDAVTTSRAHRPPPHVAEVPTVLCSLLGNLPLDDLNWKTKAPGISSFEIPLSRKGNSHLQLLRIGAGRKMPEHGHGGEEITVMLRGSYSDHTGRYSAGDVADFDEDMEHQPVVDAASECICLVATEAPTRFKSFWARLAQPFVGI